MTIDVVEKEMGSAAACRLQLISELVLFITILAENQLVRIFPFPEITSADVSDSCQKSK